MGRPTGGVAARWRGRPGPMSPLLTALPAIGAAVAVAGVAVVVALLAYRTAPFVPLVAAAAGASLLVALVRPTLTLYAAVALVPLELVALPIGDVGITPSETMFALTGVAWAGRRIVSGQLPFSPSPLGKPFALMLLAIVPGIALAPETFPVVKILLMWTSFVLVYQMLVTEGGVDTVRRLLVVLGVAGGVVGLIAAIKSGAGSQTELIGVGEDALGRAVGSFEHPNILATFVALALPGSLALGLAGPRTLRPLTIGAFALAFGGLVFSLSRGGLLAVMGALVVMLAWRPYRRLVVVGLALALIVAVSSANPLGGVQQISQVEQRIESVAYSAQGVNPRFALWETLPEIVADYPVLGVGAANFSEVAPSYGLSNLEGGTTYDHAHNIPLTFLAELGIIGLAALIWATVVLARLLLSSYRRLEGLDRGLACALGAALVAVGVQGMVDYTVRSNVIAALLFILPACVVLLARSADRPRPDESPARPPPSGRYRGGRGPALTES